MSTRIPVLLVFLVASGHILPAHAAPMASPLRQEEPPEEPTEGDSDDPWRGPVANRNQFPPALLFISLEPERARVLPKTEHSVIVSFDYSNVLHLQETEFESLEIDLESLRILLQGKLGLGRDLELTGSLPTYWIHGGFLDPFISGFHRAFGLPNRVRSVEPDNLFRYQWQVQETPVLARENGFLAPGDLTLQLKRAVSWKELGTTELAARAAVKLPTGSRDRLVSSGGTDLGLGVELSRVGRKVGGFFNLSYHVTSDLEQVASRNFFSWMAAIDWHFKPALSAVVQYDEFRPMLESEIRVLNQSGRQIVVGLRWRRSDRFDFEWRFAEDLSTTSTDFTLGFQIHYHWKSNSLAEGVAEPADGHN